MSVKIYLGGRYYNGTVKVPRLFPEECRRIKKILLIKVIGILRLFDLYLEVDVYINEYILS